MKKVKLIVFLTVFCIIGIYVNFGENFSEKSKICKCYPNFNKLCPHLKPNEINYNGWVREVHTTNTHAYVWTDVCMFLTEKKCLCNNDSNFKKVLK